MPYKININAIFPKNYNNNNKKQKAKHDKYKIGNKKIKNLTI